MAMLRPLTPAEELAFLKEIHGTPAIAEIFAGVRDSLTVLQTRSQMLLGLITICLTVTGFSGRQIAETGWLSRGSVLVGVLSVLVAAVILIAGPLQVRWVTQYRAETVDATLVTLIERRNRKTTQYQLAAVWLLVGLIGYVLSLAFYLASGPV
jgi:hypothetical protein